MQMDIATYDQRMRGVSGLLSIATLALVLVGAFGLLDRTPIFVFAVGTAAFMTAIASGVQAYGESTINSHPRTVAAWIAISVFYTIYASVSFSALVNFFQPIA